MEFTYDLQTYTWSYTRNAANQYVIVIGPWHKTIPNFLTTFDEQVSNQEKYEGCDMVIQDGFVPVVLPKEDNYDEDMCQWTCNILTGKWTSNVMARDEPMEDILMCMINELQSKLVQMEARLLKLESMLKA